MDIRNMLILLTLTMLVNVISSQSNGTTTRPPVKPKSVKPRRSDLNELYSHCTDVSPSDYFCIGSKGNRVSYKGLQSIGGTCIFDQDCNILIKAQKVALNEVKGNQSEPNSQIGSIIWTVGLKNIVDASGTKRQHAKVAFVHEPTTKKHLRDCCEQPSTNGMFVRDVMYMEVNTHEPSRSAVVVSSSVTVKDVSGLRDAQDEKFNEYYRPQAPINNYGGYFVQKFTSPRTVSIQEDLTAHLRTFFVDFSAPVSCTAFHLTERPDGKNVWKNQIYGLIPINIFKESLIDKVGSSKEDEGSNLLWLWILLGILFLLLLLFIIWLICRRQARDRKRYERSEAHTGRTLKSTNDSGVPKSQQGHRSSSNKLPYSSPAGPISSPETDSKATAGSLRSGMSNTTAASKASSASKRSKMTSLHSAGSSSSKGSSSKNDY